MSLLRQSRSLLVFNPSLFLSFLYIYNSLFCECPPCLIHCAVFPSSSSSLPHLVPISLMVVPETLATTTSTTRHSVASNASGNTVLNHNGGRHLEIAAIESTFMVHEYNRKKRKWVKKARTVCST